MNDDNGFLLALVGIVYHDSSTFLAQAGIINGTIDPIGTLLMGAYLALFLRLLYHPTCLPMRKYNMLDFMAVFTGQRKIADLATDVTLTDLQAATDAQIDEMVTLIRELSDAEVVFIAADPAAEGGIGWNVAHLVAHVTASSEENAAVSSILARGIDYPFEPRLRYETDWTTLTTTAACLQRLEESRRIRQGYLNAWPDRPRLDTHRTLPPAFAERVGQLNAMGACLLGLVHEAGQLAQLRDIIAQAKKTISTE